MVMLKQVRSCAALALILLSLGACSQDKHVFVSTMFVPLTLELEDQRTHENIWKKDIPVDYKLVVDFDRPTEFEPIWANMEPATVMHWRLYEVRTDSDSWFADPNEEGQLDLPGTPIMMRVSVRPSPEYKPGYKPHRRETPITPAPLTEPPPAANAPGAPPPQPNNTPRPLPDDLPATPAPAPTTAPATGPSP